jgi:hypothetical protein
VIDVQRRNAGRAPLDERHDNSDEGDAEPDRQPE